MEDDLPEINSGECLRVPIKKFKPDEIEEKVKERALDKSTQDVLRKTMKEGTDTVWDRFRTATAAMQVLHGGNILSTMRHGPVPTHGRRSNPRRVRSRCRPEPGQLAGGPASDITLSDMKSM